MNKQGTLSIRVGAVRHSVPYEDVGRDLDALDIGCVHCGSDEVDVTIDILQLGFWEDDGLLVRICRECGKAYAIKYVIDSELTDEGIGVNDRPKQ